METCSASVFGGDAISFKSYYVVWKLQNENDIGRSIEWFKSYYVVWKQKEQALWRRKVRGLNRTM